MPTLDEMVARLPNLPVLGALAATLKDQFHLRDGSVEPRVICDPGDLKEWENKLGEELFFELAGTTDGKVWGTDIYTSDSKLAAAAVHAGVLAPGENGVVRVRVVPVLERYHGSTRNGVISLSYDNPWHGAFQIERASGRGLMQCRRFGCNRL